MFIVAFDHNSSVEMNGAHHMICSFAKSAPTGGKDIAFTDSKYMKNTSNPCFHMNSSNTNNGGWASSYMRQTICSQFKNAMPSDLRDLVRQRAIYTANIGEGDNDPSSVTKTTDYVYIPSEFEVKGSTFYANSAEQSHQQQLTYYKNGASRIRYDSLDISTEVIWWTRSSTYFSPTNFVYLDTNGVLEYTIANRSYGFAPLITI